MAASQHTSPQGIEFLERHEGVVLKAYRDVAGVWTIGAGLTRGSGVVVPKAGLQISKAQAKALLGEALSKNYEPRVRRAMPKALQREFDAGISFDYNTGKIDQASWVDAWKRGDWPDTERRLKMWVKAGGKRVRGLVNRREAEWKLLRFGDYGDGAAVLPTPEGVAKVSASIDGDTLAKVHAGLATLGYASGDGDLPLSSAVVLFQADHDLTRDGIIGPATAATVQRQLDARRKLVAPAGTAAAGGAMEAAPTPHPDVPDWLGLVVLGVGALWALWLLWQYRDWVAARVQGWAPGLARLLRSV